MLSIDTSQMQSLVSDLGAAAAKLPVTAAAKLKAEAADAEKTMQAAAPVLTGALRGSIGTTWRGPLAAEVGTDLEYAGYVEGGTSDTPPQPFMGPTADKIEGTDAFDDLLEGLL